MTISPLALDRTRAALRAGTANRRLAHAHEALLAQARSLAGRAPLAVTDKPAAGPSGVTHDFYSIGKYAWPDPARPGGMPYLRRDCFINPDVRSARYDKARYDEMVERTRILTLAAFLSGDQELGRAAARVLRAWFVDPATAMTPHLRHAAVLPGVNDGAAIGVIEGAVLAELLDHVRLLEAAGGWAGEDRAGLRAWMARYAHWLRTSPFGTAAGALPNNHGSFWVAQLAAASHYAGTATPELVASVANLARRHVREQIAPDGMLPAEMARPDAWQYATFGLRALLTEAQVLALLGVDLWALQTGGGERGLGLAVEFLLPYLRGQDWPYSRVRQDEQNHAEDHAVAVARMASTRLTDPVVSEAHLRLAHRPRDVLLTV